MTERDERLIVELGLEERVRLLLENEAMKTELAAYHAKDAEAAALAAKRSLPGFADWTQLESFHLSASNGMHVRVEPEIQCHIVRGWSFINTSGDTAHSTWVVDGDAELEVELACAVETVRGKIEHKESTSDGQSYHITNKLTFSVTIGGEVKTICFECSGMIFTQLGDSAYEVVAGVMQQDGEMDPCTAIRGKISFESN